MNNNEPSQPPVLPIRHPDEWFIRHKTMAYLCSDVARLIEHESQPEMIEILRLSPGIRLGHWRVCCESASDDAVRHSLYSSQPAKEQVSI